MVKQTGYIFKQQILRLPGFSHSGKLKEQRSSWVCEAMPASSNAETLARKSATEKFKGWHTACVCFSDIFTEPLSPRIKQRAVTALGVFIPFAMPYTFKPSGPAQPLPKTADPCKHI